ncbi:MAG TPA: HdeD family acid-resistance protein [Gemmatimonadaceae bacterium]|nr:HdeD family acid-resistance protein [Gemmatimonadaceae bacterium]
MLQSIIKDWWVFVLRGVFAILFGLIALFMPQITVVTFVLLFAAFAILEGVLAISLAFRAGRAGGGIWWGAFFAGLLGLAAGVLTFLYPHVTALALLYLIAVWAIVTGVSEIAAAIRLRKEIDNEWLLGLSGALSVVFGLLLLARPGAGAIAVSWLIGAYAIAFGIMLIALGFRVRGVQQRLATPTAR